jgi:hypothetical protein
MRGRFLFIPENAADVPSGIAQNRLTPRGVWTVSGMDDTSLWFSNNSTASGGKKGVA